MRSTAVRETHVGVTCASSNRRTPPQPCASMFGPSSISGGAATVCLYDNMKVVVQCWDGEQPIYNTRFLAFATHYGFRPWACRPRRPQTKGKVERPFHHIKTHLLNGRSFSSLKQLNTFVSNVWLEQIDRRNHGTTHRTPLEMWEEEARPPRSASRACLRHRRDTLPLSRAGMAYPL